MHKSMWKMAKAAAVGTTMAVAVGAAIHSHTPAEAAGPVQATKAAPARASASSQWRKWVKKLVSYLSRFFKVRGVTFSGNGEYCIIKLEDGTTGFDRALHSLANVKSPPNRERKTLDSKWALMSGSERRLVRLG